MAPEPDTRTGDTVTRAVIVKTPPWSPRRHGLIVLIVLLSVVASACQTATPTPATAPRTDSRRLQRCTILLPLAHNDGTPIPVADLTRVYDRLYQRFGGYTLAGRVTGAYRMADGTRANDDTQEIWVAVPAEQINELRREVAGFCRLLRQESLYVEVAQAGVEFIHPVGE